MFDVSFNIQNLLFNTFQTIPEWYQCNKWLKSYNKFQKRVQTFDRLLGREPNSENRLHLILAATPCEKVIIVPDPNYITSVIRKFMLDMPSPGSFQNIGLLICAQHGSEHHPV